MFMKLPHRRQFLHLAAGAAALPTLSRVARAQAYPSRPVRIIVPFGSAGASDIVARVMGQWLSERFGQQFVIENRPGAGGNLGTEAVVRAPPDGYTLVMVGQPNAINATLYDKLSFSFISDVAPVAGVIRFPNVMNVTPSVPAKTVPEFITYAKANPGKINMASPGIGSSPHMIGELFKMMAGVDIIHVPYRSVAAAMTDLISGQVHMMFVTTAASVEYVKAGKLRALAVTSAMRAESLPDTPTVDESLRGFEGSSWYGVGAPSNTPLEIISMLNKEINLAFVDPKMRMRFADLGGTVIPGSPHDFGKLIADETQKWGKVVKLVGIKPQ
jgi:tripartite-type tricarboxylate transporter receptor subunit TctC